MRPKRSLLYIGNKLTGHGKPPSTIDYLSVKLQEEGYKVITASSIKNKLLRLLHMTYAVFLNRKKVTCVLIDTYSTYNFYYAVLVAFFCRSFKLPYMPILHGGNLPVRLKNNKKYSQYLFGGAKINVAPSQYILNKFKESGFNNLAYIPNAFEIKDYPFQIRNTISPKLLWVRSFSEIYNPLLALEIVEMLKNKNIDVSLCMVGPEKDGSLKSCKKVVENLQLPIIFTGMLQKQEWINVSKKYDIFINTTNLDNMPVSLMEAMALGLPIISTNVGGIPYLIEENKNGLLVPPNNAKAFSNAIEHICNNPIIAQNLINNARNKIEAFDWQKVKHKWIYLLDG